MRVPRNRLAQSSILLCGLLLVAAIASASAGATGDLAGMQSDLANQLRLAGPADGAYVYDLTAKQPLFSERASKLRPPASVEKLYTATTALERMGPAA
ncbi:MAG: D-alanyl-D-alanine carboxypeptidase, partial [Solirubrobacteraceae bacterium]